MPLEMSTPDGETPLIASIIFPALRPPARKNGTESLASFIRPKSAVFPVPPYSAGEKLSSNRQSAPSFKAA